MNRVFFLGLIAAAASGLSGCVVSQIHQSRDFGQAVSQNVVAQITDPNPRYPGPPPPASGARAVLAQTRYRTGTTIPPFAAASEVGISGSSAAPPAAPAAGMGPGS
jgi:hypothetical protein